MKLKRQKIFSEGDRLFKNLSYGTTCRIFSRMSEGRKHTYNPSG
jgi:hypothetical protein